MSTCCPNHDRMDLILQNDDYYDSPCGTPTAPRGERRYCCGKCPEQGQPLRLRAQWASNPMLMRELTDEEYSIVFSMALNVGPKYVDIQTALPAPAENAVPPGPDQV